MGYPMAGHLRARGHEVAVWNRTRAVAERHAAEHGTLALESLAAAAAADACLTCLPTSREVDEVAEAVAPLLPRGALWIDCTSGDPEQGRRTARRLAERGVGFVDAPVSGGLAGARQGTLTVMAGGDAADVARARPALDAFAARVVHVGPVGCGHAVKAVNNTLLAVHVLAAAEGLYTLARAGVPLEKALEAINASSGRSHATERLLPEPLTTGRFPQTFKLSLLEKDVRIGARLVAGSGLEAPITALAVEVVRNARAELGGDADYLELVKVTEPRRGAQRRDG